ncbi:MAG: ferrous iron transport protein A [Bacteroidia bacterium]|nr:ferrous iron transport protein A [Bacteroidia bacterium]
MEKTTCLLSQTEEGKLVKIKAIKDLAAKNNLSRIGIFVNNEIYVSKISLGGSPIAIQTNDIEVAVRKDIASLIEVEVIS